MNSPVDHLCQDKKFKNLRLIQQQNILQFVDVFPQFLILFFIRPIRIGQHGQNPFRMIIQLTVI
uniref:Uncharacterized protein n=1 Tax=Romanomermis culicivorax TaxID=13658 RepID=A0A915KQ81_ROMCU